MSEWAGLVRREDHVEGGFSLWVSLTGKTSLCVYSTCPGNIGESCRHVNDFPIIGAVPGTPASHRLMVNPEPPFSDIIERAAKVLGHFSPTEPWFSTVDPEMKHMWRRQAEALRLAGVLLPDSPSDPLQSFWDWVNSLPAGADVQVELSKRIEESLRSLDDVIDEMGRKIKDLRLSVRSSTDEDAAVALTARIKRCRELIKNGVVHESPDTGPAG